MAVPVRTPMFPVTASAEKPVPADKTGTKTAENPQGDIVVSFVGVAPIDDPEVIVLVALAYAQRTTGTYPSGGNMAAPPGGQPVFPDSAVSWH